MSKVLVLYPNYNNNVVRGGQIYDHYFIDRIIYSKKHSVDFITEKFSLLSALSKFSLAKKYDVVLTNSRLYPQFIFLWLALCFFSECRLICTHHQFDYKNYYRNNLLSIVKKPIRYILELLFISVSTAIIIPTPYLKNIFQKKFPQKKIFYVELGLTDSFLSNNTITGQCNEQRRELLYVGAVSTGKGIHILIDALNIIKQKSIAFNCIIAGYENSSKYYGVIKQKIKKYKLENNILLTGFIQANKLSTYYDNADIFVFPSLLESYGMVLLEAMAYGLPVVAFNNSAIPYTVKDDINGLLCKNKDANDFAFKLEKLLKDDNLYKKLSAGALHTFSQTRKMTDMYPDIDKFIQWLS